jgi:2-hydroxycyclohexanecarboxyl-CoA dehydrogenase
MNSANPIGKDGNVMSEVNRTPSSLTELLDLTGQVALVTGAGQGVGATIARFLAAQGAAVAVNDYYADRARAIAEEITAVGGAAIGVAADVTAFDDVVAMVADVSHQLGDVSILVNNAGNAGTGPRPVAPFWESDPTAWEPFMAVNLSAVMSCCRAVAPGMIAMNRGRLITVISDAGRVGEAGLEAYSAAKAGAAGLMRALARSLGRFGITSNSVAIGITRTPAMTKVLANEEMVKRVLSQYTIRRVGEPTDAAAMIAFLASEAASWITGQTYPVNGGFSVSQ